MKITTSVARNISARDGHDTLFISASTAIKKSAIHGTFTARNANHRPPKTSHGHQYLA